MTTTSRPDPPFEPPAGHHFQAQPEPDPDWVLLDTPAGADVGPGGCRWIVGKLPRKACGAPAVAALDRAIGNPQFRGQRRRRWWRYCAKHLYGRWIEDGQLMRWRLLPDGSTQDGDSDG